MRKTLERAAALLLVILCIPCLAGAETIVTSFYPIWLFTMNLTEGLEGLEVRNLTAPDTGCLHDYQLQMADMKVLEGADVFLVNGAGMESFLPRLEAAFPDLPVVSASEGIDLLQDGDALQIGEAETEFNAHLWLDVSRAIHMCENLAGGLEAAFPARAEAIRANLEAYRARLEQLDQDLREGLSGLPRREIITFHEAFPYFASAYGLKVVAVVNKEPGETVSAAQMAELVSVIRELGNPPLFVEPQYEDLSARTLAEETGAPVYTLDPVVTGPETDVPLDYYESVMRENMTTLQAALGG